MTSNAKLDAELDNIREYHEREKQFLKAEVAELREEIANSNKFAQDQENKIAELRAQLDMQTKLRKADCMYINQLCDERDTLKKCLFSMQNAAIDLTAQLDELKTENGKLAAGQCVVPNGMLANREGVYCSLKQQVDSYVQCPACSEQYRFSEGHEKIVGNLEAQLKTRDEALDVAVKALEYFKGSEFNFIADEALHSINKLLGREKV